MDRASGVVKVPSWLTAAPDTASVPAPLEVEPVTWTPSDRERVPEEKFTVAPEATW